MTTLELYTKVTCKGFAVVVKWSVPGAGFAMYNLSAGFLSFARGPEYGFLTIKLYGLVAN